MQAPHDLASGNVSDAVVHQDRELFNHFPNFWWIVDLSGRVGLIRVFALHTGGELISEPQSLIKVLPAYCFLELVEKCLTNRSRASRESPRVLIDSDRANCSMVWDGMN